MAEVRQTRRKFAKKVQVVAIAVAGVVAVFLGFLEYTQRPSFCKTCHYMEPYYKSWQESSHNQVNCLKCHYPPGFRSVIRAKVVALSQVVQYVTKTYGTKPWAEVEDGACLRSGCHETRLLAGTVPFGPDGTINFDHSHHLKDLKRGKQLRCTSCHAQIVQGEHLTVTSSTCFLCHFKNLDWQQDLSRCQTCHDASKIPKSRFDHSHVLAKDVDCRRCHGNITRGTGEVPRQHCLSCHNEADRLGKYEDIDLIHRKHVAEHKVECSECHIEITHSMRKVTLAEPLHCQDCHSGAHENQLRLYVGASAVEPHRPPEPSPMQQVNVHCVGCHTAEKALAQGGKVRTTTPESCDSCHSPGYGKVLEDWRAILARRIPETEQALGVVARAVAGAPEAQTALRHAQGKLQEVKAGHGVHNIGFALALLAEAQTEAVNLARRAGLALQVSGVPEAHVMKSNECRMCHLRPPEGVLNFSGTSFPHGAHGRALEQCTECHTPRSDHGKTTITPQDCARCHGGLAMPHPAGFRRRAREEMARAGVSTCAQCHKGERAAACQPCHSSPPPDLQWGEVTFSHQRHRKYPEIQCVSCHSRWPDHGRLVVNQQQCTQCHGGLEMPHPADWAEAHPAFARERGIESCEKCHAGGMSGEFCATCHG